MKKDGKNPGIVLVASLFIHPGREVEFRQFETEAARIMQKYGGRIERVIRPTTSGQSDSSPHEIHLVSFPSVERFEAYRRDAALATLAPLRQRAVARTEVIIGKEGEPYL
jgi:uncharacterized protein (DUF1330 family)